LGNFASEISFALEVILGQRSNILKKKFEAPIHPFQKLFLKKSQEMKGQNDGEYHQNRYNSAAFPFF